MLLFQIKIIASQQKSLWGSKRSRGKEDKPIRKPRKYAEDDRNESQCKRIPQNLNSQLQSSQINEHQQSFVENDQILQTQNQQQVISQSILKRNKTFFNPTIDQSSKESKIEQVRQNVVSYN